MAKEITISSGAQAVVDDALFPLLNVLNWCEQNGYAYSAKLGYMHRAIMGAMGAHEVDHIDGDRLNNQTYNLRMATASNNQCNRGVQRNNTSGFKGVYRSGKRWLARIHVNYKAKRLGSFATAQEAHEAYVAAARELHGAYAKW